MQNMIRPLAPIACGLLLAACVAPAPMPQPPPPATELPPIATSSASLPASASQTLYAAFGDREAALSCGLKSVDGGWRAVCVNALGLRVLTLGVDAAGQLTAERGKGVPEALDPRRVLADVQLCLWPLASLQQGYGDSGWTVDEPIAGTRRQRYAGRLVAEVHYAPGAPWSGQLWLANLAKGYTLSLLSEPAAAP